MMQALNSDNGIIVKALGMYIAASQKGIDAQKLIDRAIILEHILRNNRDEMTHEWSSCND
jgi:hypothetical protein